MSSKRVIIAIFIIIIIFNIFLFYAYNSQPTSTKTNNDLNAVAWKPNDEYALIVGERGTMLKYDGDSFEKLDVPTTETLWDVAWARDGKHALIVGGKGTIFLYNETGYVNIDSYTTETLSGVTWQNLSVAFIVGGSGTVFRLEEENLIELPRRSEYDLKDIEWYPNPPGDYGLIVGENGTVIKEYGTDYRDGTDYEELSAITSSYLWKVSWRPFYDEALIVGERGTALLYRADGSVKRLSSGVSNWLTDVSWKFKGDSALIVGTNGLLLRYDGKDFSREASATNFNLGGVDWKRDGSTAILVGDNGIVRKYPNLILSPETIILIWYGEIFLGLGVTSVLLYNSIISKRRKKALPPVKDEEKKKGKVRITSAVGLNHNSLFYRIKIENRMAYPISDITVKPYISKDNFILDQSEKNIPLIRANHQKSVRFKLRPKPKEHGEADVLGRINYYEPDIDGYEEKLLRPRPIRIILPELKGEQINEDEWEKITDKLLKTEETMLDIPISGEECMEFALDIIKGKDMYMISQSVNEGGTYSATARFYALGENNSTYGLDLRVAASGKNDVPSRLKFGVYAENNESLLGLYYLILDEIEGGLEKIEKDFTMMRHVVDFKSRIEKMEKDIAEQRTLPVPDLEEEVKVEEEPRPDLFKEFDRLRKNIENIEKDKIGVDSKFKSLYELDELYKILAEDLVQRKVLDIKIGEEAVKNRLGKTQLEDLKRFEDAYALLCEAETSANVLTKEDFPNSGKKAILLVYFNAVEVYVREKLKELIPKGVTILLGEDYGHINTRKKDWEKIWATLSLGSCIHIINNNRYLFLRDEEQWDKNVETLMHQVRELRNTVAHPSSENPDPKLVRKKVYALLGRLPDVLKTKE